MLTQSFTHKSNKIATLTTTDNYKQLFVLIAMLLTVLSVQPSTFAMAAPLEQQQPRPHSQPHTRLHQQPQHNLLHQSQLNDILATDTRHTYDHHNNNYANHNHNNNNYHQHRHLHDRQHERQQQEQLETDLTANKNQTLSDYDEERLRKRAVSWHDYYNSVMQTQIINWYNPCGGISKTNEIPFRRNRPLLIKRELKKLQNTVAKNYNLMKETLHTIKIKEMRQWGLFKKKYSFLPKLNANSSISLRRWHHQIQVYVAAFEYLRRAQLHFDNVKPGQESDIALELNELMKNARNILCNIEHAINNTTTRKAALNINSLFITPPKMEAILNFTTDIKFVSPLRWNQIKDDMTEKSVDSIDLKFVKSHYYGFIRNLLKVLRAHTKRPNRIYLGKGGNKTPSTATSTLPPKQQQHRQTQQKQKNEQARRERKRQNPNATKKRHSKKKLE